MNRTLRIVSTLGLGFLALALVPGQAQAASLTLDENFRPPLFAEPIPPQRALLLPDGKFLLFFNTDTLTDLRTGAITRYLADGSLDTSFASSREYKSVTAAAPTADGHLIIAASQFFYGGNSGTEQILRLNPDGSIDPTFNISVVHPESYITVRGIVIQPDGRILVTGSFENFAGSARQKIVRLLADGAVDSSFTSPQFTGGYYGVYAKPVTLANGKILIAGDFATLNGVANLGIAQLNADGSVDPSFQASGFTRYPSSTSIRGLAVQSDGKIVIAGRFRIGTGSPIRRTPVIRLNADGSLDPSYLFELFGTDGVARDLLIQPDGKAVAVITDSVFRFEATGPVDSSFTPPYLLDITSDPFGASGVPVTVNLQPDGRMIVGGVFTDVNPSGTPDRSHFGVVRLNSDGSVDPTLVASHRTGFENFPSSFTRLSDGSAWVAFGIPSIRNDPAMNFNLGRLLPSGLLDPSFSLSSSDPGTVLSKGFIAQDFAQLADGSYFVFGNRGGGKFLPNGVQDLTFQPATAGAGKATALPDGKVLLSSGVDPQQTLFSSLTRLRSNGTFEGYALPQSINSGQVIRDKVGDVYQMYVGSHVLAVQPNGKVLFLYFLSDQLFHFIRLNVDGSVDDSFSGATFTPIDLFVDYPYIFDPWVGSSYQPYGGVWSATALLQDALILSDGKILLCGAFTSYNGVPARGMVRLQPNGAVDDTFNIGGGAQWTKTTETASFFPVVESMEDQGDGKLLIAGTFEAFDGTPLPGLASLNPDGSIDASFTPPAKRQRLARGTARLARQPDGSFLLSGPYSFPNETEPTFIHINSTGGVPVIGSPILANAVVDQPFSYQVTASGQPTSYNAWGLPPGFSIDPETGLITGTPTSLNIGIFTIIVAATNDEGSSALFYLTLTVIPSQVGPSPNLLNIATRLKVLSGDNTLIGGFIITGYPPKRVIIRAVGPSLTNLGISDALPDPVLELHGPGKFTTITNDNWRDTQQSEIEATGIPPSHDMESAIVATLPAGPYTAIVRGINDGTGVGLVEVYDLDTTADAQLANISTRGFVDAGVNVMIGGLIAGPTAAGSSRMLVRAIGPSLASLGVPNALPDPSLELHDVNGALIASNDNWRDTQQSAIEATGIAPTDDNESAILWVLSPGSYTAVVQGAHLETGVGLVEVYNLP